MALVQIPGEEEEEEYVYDGPVLQMSSAVLPSNFPLFDLKDWPKSRAALVPGGVTRNFEKACWNALMDRMDRAAWEAGFYFYDAEAGYGPKDLKMTTGVFGTLTADRMNAVVAAFDNFLPWRWIWKFERDPPYPLGTMGMKEGYWSKSVFFGASDKFGREPDVVYPEYILGLIDRVNMLIEFMKDTYPNFTDVNPKTVPFVPTVKTGVRSGLGRSFAPKPKCRTHIGSPQIVDGLADHLESWNYFRSSILCDPEVMAYGTLSLPVYWAPTPIKATGHVRRATRMHCESVKVQSLIRLMLEPGGPCELFASKDSRTLQQVLADYLVLTMFSAENKSFSVSGGELFQKPPFGVTVEGKSNTSVAKAPVVPAPPAPVVLQDRRKTFSKTEDTVSLPGQGVETSQKQFSNTPDVMVYAFRTFFIKQKFWKRFFSSQSTKGVVAPEAFEVKQDHISRLNTSCEGVRSAMGQEAHVEKISRAAVDAQVADTPGREVAVDGHAVSKGESSLDYLFVTPVGINQKSGTSCVCGFSTLWEAPRWVDGGLLIRQSRKTKILADGSMDLSCGYDPMYAQATSRTSASAGLDTKWLPPVWFDGGLYIRQLREVIVLPDGGLDLSSGGEELLPKQISVTTAACRLGTLWEPPVMVDGGLYLRQTHSAVQNENHELEVQ